MHEEKPVPTWTRDFVRALGVSLFGALFFTFFIWLASTGLMVSNNFDIIEADLVTGLVTPKGILKPAEIKEHFA